MASGVFIYYIFNINMLVHLICEINREDFSLKIPLCFYKYCLKLSKG